jgi:hypothetical protein
MSADRLEHYHLATASSRRAGRPANASQQQQQRRRAGRETIFSPFAKAFPVLYSRRRLCAACQITRNARQSRILAGWMRRCNPTLLAAKQVCGAEGGRPAPAASLSSASKGQASQSEFVPL